MKMPIYVVRAATLRELRTKRDLYETYKAKANEWSDHYLKATARADEAEETIEDQGRQLAALRRELAEANGKAARAHDECEGLRSVLAQSDSDLRQARDELAAQRAEFEVLAAEVRDLQAAAADTASGQTVRAAIALGLLRSLLSEARAHGRDLGRLDLVEVILFGRAEELAPEEHGYAEEQAEGVRPS